MSLYSYSSDGAIDNDPVDDTVSAINTNSKNYVKDEILKMLSDKAIHEETGLNAYNSETIH